MGLAPERQSILKANGAVGADIIAFSIGTEFQTINLASPLPTTTETFTINSASQPGFSGTLLIVTRRDAPAPRPTICQCVGGPHRSQQRANLLGSAKCDHRCQWQRHLSGAGVSTTTTTTTQRFISSTTTGQVFYDADGTGGSAPVTLATLTGAPALSAANIAIV
jgi:hypothetical protein